MTKLFLSRPLIQRKSYGVQSLLGIIFYWGWNRLLLRVKQAGTSTLYRLIGFYFNWVLYFNWVFYLNQVFISTGFYQNSGLISATNSGQEPS